MSRLTHIFLDLDGPLLDGKLRHYDCYRDILEEHHLKPLPIDQYWDLKRDRVDRKHILAMSEAEHLYERFLELWLQRIESEKYLALDRLQHHCLETLSSWKHSGIKLFLVTLRNNPYTLKRQLEKLGISAFIDEWISAGSSQGARGKAKAARSVIPCGDSNRVVWIGDTEVDIEAARLLGMSVCALSCGLRTRGFLERLRPEYLETDLYAFAKYIENSCRLDITLKTMHF